MCSKFRSGVNPKLAIVPGSRKTLSIAPSPLVSRLVLHVRSAHLERVAKVYFPNGTHARRLLRERGVRNIDRDALKCARTQLEAER